MTHDLHALTSQASRRASRGFMLVAVIWISGLVAAFAISVTVSVRSHVLHARNAMSEVLAAGIADGIARLEVLQLSQDGRVKTADGSWRSCRWVNEADAWVSIQDQSGLVDLNTASPPMMLALLEGLALGRSQAEELASAMRDYRDGDRVAEVGGTEPETYLGRSFGPKNAPFDAVEELDQLPGMTHELLEQLLQFTTVSNQQAGISFDTAPAELLRKLGLSWTSVAGLQFSAPRMSRVTAIIVAVRLNDGTRFVRQAVIERTDQPSVPFAVISWGTGAWPASAGTSNREVPCLQSADASASQLA